MRRRLKISVGDKKTIFTCLIKSDKFALFKKVQFQVPKMQILALEWTNSFSMSRSNKFRSYFALNNQRVAQVSNPKKFVFIKKRSFLPKHESEFSISLSDNSFFGEDERVSSIFWLRDFDENTTDEDCIDEGAEETLYFGQNLILWF